MQSQLTALGVSIDHGSYKKSIAKAKWAGGVEKRLKRYLRKMKDWDALLARELHMVQL